MRTPDAIRAEIDALRDKLDALEVELQAARMAQLTIPFTIGQRVKWHGQEYEIGAIDPWGTDNAWLRGYKIKKNGERGAHFLSITSAQTLLSSYDEASK